MTAGVHILNLCKACLQTCLLCRSAWSGIDYAMTFYVYASLLECTRLSDEELHVHMVADAVLSRRTSLQHAHAQLKTAVTGTIGGTYATPLINPPEVAIVALGKVRYLPRFAANGEVEKAALLNISWGADHRVLDGATLAEFSNKWKQFIEQPDRLLLRLR